MWPCESSQTPCVLPYLILAGSSPQSCVTSYLWSPSPRIGLADPDLLAAPRIIGADSACTNVRLVAFSIMKATVTRPDPSRAGETACPTRFVTQARWGRRGRRFRLPCQQLQLV